MKDIAIYGAGGFGRETALLVNQINNVARQWNLVGFYDDGIDKGAIVGRLPILGDISDLKKIAAPTSIVIAISDSQIRKEIVEKLKHTVIDYPKLIHPTCQLGDDGNAYGKGCIISAGVIFTTGVILEDFVIVNLSSTIGHDVRLQSFSTIMPGCSISGNVRIGEGSMVGTGARILQNLTIGSNCKIGAGAVVTRDFADNKTIIGIPAYEK
ncbi:acetyltransferase [soil metagenome]